MPIMRESQERSPHYNAQNISSHITNNSAKLYYDEELFNQTSKDVEWRDKSKSGDRRRVSRVCETLFGTTPKNEKPSCFSFAILIMWVIAVLFFCMWIDGCGALKSKVSAELSSAIENGEPTDVHLVTVALDDSYLNAYLSSGLGRKQSIAS